jgi:hypothetical protein
VPLQTPDFVDGQHGFVIGGRLPRLGQVARDLRLYATADGGATWTSVPAGVASASTAERLRAAEAAEAAGTLESSQARTLAEAFDFIFALRLDHQVEQLRRGEAPDDFIDPKTLNPLARSPAIHTDLHDEVVCGLPQIPNWVICEPGACSRGESRERYLGDYEKLSKEPGFLILRLLKPARPNPSPPN